MIQGTKFYTKAITEAITINGSDGVVQITLSVVTGTCILRGNFPFQGDNAGDIELAEGTTITLSGSSPSGPIDGLTITPTGGTTNVAMNF